METWKSVWTGTPRYWDKAAVATEEAVPLVLLISASNAVLSDAGMVVFRFTICFLQLPGGSKCGDMLGPNFKADNFATMPFGTVNLDISRLTRTRSEPVRCVSTANIGQHIECGDCNWNDCALVRLKQEFSRE